MKIALGQLNVKAGQLEQNVSKMKEMIQQAKRLQADLIIFPELSISGSILGDKWFDSSFNETLIAYNDEIKEASEGIGIIWGNIDLFHSNRWNCAYFAYNKEWVKKENSLFPGKYIKMINKNERIFDDSRYFSSASDFIQEEENTSPFIFEKDGTSYRIGCEIGEDMNHQNCDLIVNISSTPWYRNQSQKVPHQSRPTIYVNTCGMQNNSKTVCVYEGNSRIYNAQKECIANCNDSFKEECKVVDFNQITLTSKCEHQLLEALLCAIREFDEQVFGSRFKWIIGLSGGLDSSVNAALLTMALGNERIIGLNMATRYNSSTTIDNAHQLAHQLGIDCRDGIIQKLVEEQIHCLQQYTENEISEFAIENIQARIRGSVLGGIAQIENGVIVNNGNKVEGALGYATLYGDTIGCLAPIQDCTKVDLFDLSHTINHVLGKEVIPENLLPEVQEDTIHWIMPPSAELKNNQRDPMKWFYHDELVRLMTESPHYEIEKLMEKYLNQSIYQESIGKWIKYYGLDNPQDFIDDLEWFLSKMELGVFKRLQTPPIVMTTSGCFGSDFRENQVHYQKSNRYLQLKEAILSGKVCD